MALVSPGVEVTIVDESQYLPAAPASVPLILLATAQNKANGEGTGVAAGTLAANANKLYRVTSQKDLISLFGNPFFYKTTNGTPLQGYELNEYGLLTAYSLLGSTNLCYVVRADIDMATLVGRTGRPSGAVPNGTYWLDINGLSTTWGIHEFDKNSGAFVFKSPIILNDSEESLEGGASGSGKPLDSIGKPGDYAVTFRADPISNRSEAARPDTYSTYWYKALDVNVDGAGGTATWVAVGSREWMNAWPVVQGTKANPVITLSDPLATDTAITLVINGVAVALDVDSSLTLNPDSTSGGIVGKINDAQIPFLTAKAVNNKLELYMSNGQPIMFDPTSDADAINSLGVTSGINYNSVAVFYGTNAQQPSVWRSSKYDNDGATTSRPTGSVWVKTNAANNGSNMVVRQYVSALETYTTLPCPMAANDWTVSNQLDSTGGKNIPVGAVYAQYSHGANSMSAPVQFYRKSMDGPSVFTTTAPFDFEFTVTSTLTVQVSVPGLSALSEKYTVSVVAGDTLEMFANKWNAVVPYTRIDVTTLGSLSTLSITHFEGGVIVVDDAGVNNSAITELGFVVGTNVANNSSFTKWGPYKTRSYSNVEHPAIDGKITGTTAKFYIETFGDEMTLVSATDGGSEYLGGGSGEMLISMGVGAAGAKTEFVVKATVDAGIITDVEWYSGFAIPSYSILLSPWTPMNFIPNPVAPSVYPVNNTPWYFSAVSQADIMIQFGGKWMGYSNVAFDSNGNPIDADSTNPVGQTDPNGVIMSADAPENQTSGSPLVYGDLWLDTNDLENYPSLSRWQNVEGIDQWVKIDNTDQTSENGIVFADARWGATGAEDPIFDALPSISAMLTSDYVDPDAPDATAYPAGTLMFNTRRSGYNVKEFRLNYFNVASFPDVTLPQEKSTWVSVSGNKTDGSPYMGRKAQRNMVVKALRAAIDSNAQVREEDTFFNLIACPGYPELQPNLVVLNNDRNQTAYIIGDTPLRLSEDPNEIVAWATNASGSTGTGEDGLVTRDTFMGLYYPSGITTDPTGAEVAVPSSHMILRTMIYNDTVAYPWFAPAGQRRGIIDNATNIGYIDKETGEFVTIKNRSALRNVEYTNFINPIAYFTNLGLLNFGNKNSFDSQSALDRTNVARLICYLRWNIQIALRPFIFEPNDTSTRSQARGVIQSLLADVQAKRGIYDYLVVCDESNNTPARIDRNELWVDVAIEPVKAAEFIYVPVRIMNTGEL